MRAPSPTDHPRARNAAATEMLEEAGADLLGFTIYNPAVWSQI